MTFQFACSPAQYFIVTFWPLPRMFVIEFDCRKSLAHQLPRFRCAYAVLTSDPSLPESINQNIWPLCSSSGRTLYNSNSKAYASYIFLNPLELRIKFLPDLYAWNAAIIPYHWKLLWTPMSVYGGRVLCLHVICLSRNTDSRIVFYIYPTACMINGRIQNSPPLV